MVNEKEINAEAPLLISEELNQLLGFIKTDLSRELPTLTIDLEYFILGTLTQKRNFLFSDFDSLLFSDTIDALYSSFYQTVSTRALTAVKNGRVPIYDKSLEEVLDKAEQIARGMDSEVITSEHVFLAIDSNSKIKKLFNKFGVTDNIIEEKSRFRLNENSEQPKEEKPEKTNKKNKRQHPNLPALNRTNVQIINMGEMEEDEAKQFLQSMFRHNNGPYVPPEEMESPLPVPAKGGKKSDTPFIQAYCTNLNDLAKAGKIEPLIGREREINEIIRILGRKKKNNAILVGGEGVGKTAIGESIAYKIVKEEVPEFLMGKKIVSLDMTALVAGTTLRGMFEERVKGILTEIKDNPKFILFIDNIGAVLADKGRDDYNLSSMISRSLDVGELQIIGTSDFSSFRKTFDKDPSLSRRFQKIIVEAPSIEESYEILKGLKTSYEEFHNVIYDDDAITACVQLADRYIPEKNLPDSAIDIMDEAGAYVGAINDSEVVKNKRAKITELRNSMKENKENEDYESFDAQKKELTAQIKELQEIKRKETAERKENPLKITKDDILNIVSQKTNIPVSNLSSDDKKRLVDMNNRLKSKVIGQDEAIDTICRALRRNRIGLRKNGCMYSTLAIGKTGVGKTLIAKQIAKELFGNEKALVRFDMSEYSDKVAVNKLIGSNPGYVGYEEGGQLTEAIKNHKHCVLLLDEIEKADPEIYNIFLQVLDEGFLTDNSGMKVDFKNVIIIFTSNIGAKTASDFGKGIGFNEDMNENTKRILFKELKKKFTPEFLNRIDDVIYFNNFTDEDYRKIIRLEINKFIESLNKIGYTAEYSEDTVDFIYNKIKEEKDYGARPITRAIQDTIEAEITDALLEREYEKGYNFKISCCTEKSKINVA